MARDLIPLACVALFFVPCRAQLPLPSSPWLPPDASVGARASSSQSTTPNPQWSNLLGSLIYFYDAQRSGTLSANRVSWRNDSALQDGKDVNVDLTGGFYDAGDYIKCTYPLSFTIMSVCWGATDYGKGYDMANQTAYLDSMLRWGLDWMIKTHPDPNTLYVQVADANLDNAYWGGDQDIPTPRPSYQINDTHPGTDAAAGAAAAFAACSNLYAGRSFNDSAYPGAASLQNASYASTLLTHAQQLYDFAVNAKGGMRTYQTSVPPVGEAYASSSYGDDLAIAALFLASATGSTDYFNQAHQYYSNFTLTGLDSVFNWDAKSAGLYVLFAQLAHGSNGFSANLSGWQAESERYFDRIVSGQSKTSGGLLWYDGDSDDASLNPALNAAMLMRRYAPIASSQAKQSSYLSLAWQQVEYTLGNNPMRAPYVVGVNPNSPSNPHSAMASGGDDSTRIDTVPAQEAYVLAGAVVGGPDKQDRFYDLRSDWVESEVALDYNAPMLTLAAMHVTNDTTDPFYTQLQPGEYASHKPSGRPCDESQPSCGSGGLSPGAKIAIGVVVGVVGLLVIVFLLYWFWRVRKSHRVRKY